MRVRWTVHRAGYRYMARPTPAHGACSGRVLRTAQECEGLHVMGVRVQVEDAEGFQFPAGFPEPGQVTGERRRIAGHVTDRTWVGGIDLVHDHPAGPGARRVQQYGVEAAFMGAQHPVHASLDDFHLRSGEQVLAGIPAGAWRAFN